jgi:hypothetical protein
MRKNLLLGTTITLLVLAWFRSPALGFAAVASLLIATGEALYERYQRAREKVLAKESRLIELGKRLEADRDALKAEIAEKVDAVNKRLAAIEMKNLGR